jgi:hypothetical protein
MIRLLLLLGACALGPSFADVEKIDTIEAWEQFLVDNPGGRHTYTVEKRLEELYFAKGLKEGTTETWRAYHARFPKSPNKDRAMKELAFNAYADAVRANTVEAYDAFVSEFAKVDPRLKQKAVGRAAVLKYGKIELGEPIVKQVNLAEDPKGELNGWGVSVDVTNAGDQELPFVALTLDYLADDGVQVLGSKEYPLVSPAWSLPASELQKTPLKPGEKRTWEWTEGLEAVPAGWTQKVRVTTTGLRLPKDASAD